MHSHACTHTLTNLQALYTCTRMHTHGGEGTLGTTFFEVSGDDCHFPLGYSASIK